MSATLSAWSPRSPGVGRTSLDVRIETYVHRRQSADRELLVTEGTFVFVAIDREGRPRPVDPA